MCPLHTAIVSHVIDSKFRENLCYYLSKHKQRKVKMRKLLKNSAGFGVIGAFLVLVVIGLVGFAGWYVVQAKNKANKPLVTQTSTIAEQASNNTELEKQPEDETANWKSYTRYGITFKYPSDWNLKANDSGQSQSTDLTSPDYETTEEVSKGEVVSVGETNYPQSGLTAENFKSRHLDPNPNPYSEYKTLIINGQKVVQFYRGDSQTTVFFLANDKTVTFGLDTFPNRAASSNVYNKMIETVVIN